MNGSFHTVATSLAVAVALAGLTVCAAAEPIDPKNPPEGRFSDEWMEIYMGGGKVGFAHSSLTRRGDRIQTEMRFRIALGRAEQTSFAKGIFAVGDVALGGVAVGGVALGGVTLGGVSVGLISMGGVAFALLAIGGVAVGGFAAGGASAGLIAVGHKAHSVIQDPELLQHAPTLVWAAVNGTVLAIAVSVVGWFRNRREAKKGS